MTILLFTIMEGDSKIYVSNVKHRPAQQASDCTSLNVLTFIPT